MSLSGMPDYIPPTVLSDGHLEPVVEKSENNDKNVDTDTATGEAIPKGKDIKDFLSRVGNLVVLIITTMNTIIAVITNFQEEIYWAAGLYLSLLVIVQVPVIVGMVIVFFRNRMAFVIDKMDLDCEKEKQAHCRDVMANAAARI